MPDGALAPMPAAPLPPAPNHLPTSGTVLAFDFGLQRIGVAVGQRMLGTARPLETIAVPDNERRFATIAGLIAEWQPDTLVVGLPFSTDGSEHDMTARARRFANQLSGRFRLPVELTDERYTSQEAEEELKRAGLDWKKRKVRLDAEAARIILEAYFETHP